MRSLGLVHIPDKMKGEKGPWQDHILLGELGSRTNCRRKCLASSGWLRVIESGVRDVAAPHTIQEETRVEVKPRC